jgi:UDP-N-acetylmuramate dehydrogenase
MTPIHNHNLQALNTLAVPACAEHFCAVHSLAELCDALKWAHQQRHPVTILGGGSNVILAPLISGLVIHIQLFGKSITLEGDDVLLRVSAGENWHQLVAWSLDQGFYGLENLALIPGTMGAAPVQNIGAYGVEISRLVAAVDTVSRRDFSAKTLLNQACEFAYRESVFKTKLRNQVVITSVTLRLSKVPKLETSYPALRDLLPTNPTPEQIFKAVCQIRRAKLPDPQTTPNCGSFFKNPIVSLSNFEKIQAKFPQVPAYSTPDLAGEPQRKLAAAWLIDAAGWKGYSRQGVGVHHQQALVLTNTQGHAADNLLQLAQQIQQSVLNQFGVTLELEPEQIGF